MYRGKLVEQGESERIFTHPTQEYTLFVEREIA
jgi:peptide/nickel transport system ATP-binding protein/oligopeptide transport system ATP-binding protein